MKKIIIKLVQSKFRTVSIHFVLLIALLASASVQALTPPHGYERLALHGSSSVIKTGIFEKKSPSFVYDNFANNLIWNFNGSSFDGTNVEDKRLIDIEVHVSGGAEPKVSLSGVWIENKGYYQQESWLVHGHTESDLINWPDKENFIPLDIEKYYINTGDFLYAVIWQRNTHKVDWEVILEAEPDDIFRKIDEGFRVVDFDQFRKHFGEGKSLGNGQWQFPFDSQQYFEAILVENSGDNYLNATWKTIAAFPQDTSWIVDPEPLGKAEVFIEPIPWPFDEFKQAPSILGMKYEGFWWFEPEEKIVDVEFVEFTGPSSDTIFPDTWAVVISHDAPDCKSIITEGVLNFGEGVSAYHAEDDVGRIIDFEGTAPFQNKPTTGGGEPWLYGHTPKFYGPPGYSPMSYILGDSTHIHACK